MFVFARLFLYVLSVFCEALINALRDKQDNVSTWHVLFGVVFYACYHKFLHSTAAAYTCCFIHCRYWYILTFTPIQMFCFLYILFNVLLVMSLSSISDCIWFYTINVFFFVSLVYSRIKLTALSSINVVIFSYGGMQSVVLVVKTPALLLLMQSIVTVLCNHSL